ncbi:MAG: MFS transporter [Elusimicrobium sp.]|jgi:fucose permease|nr:MFS transporter [Elusimicrobium sp.]
MSEKQSSVIVKLIPIMAAFFVMGFVDLVGIATNYVKVDFALSDSTANLLPSMVFLWFLICSVPTGMLMNKIGRRKTVLISLVLTIVALIIPMVSYSFASMMLSFAFLGIGNAVLQVSLNPLVSALVTGEKLASTLTFGQFVKAIASFSAPIIAAWAAAYFGNWKYLYAVFIIFPVIVFIALSLEKIKEEETTGKVSTFTECFSLLGDGVILLCFLGIICHVGVDVGVNVTAPKILTERLGFDLSKAGYATSLYFLFRTIGSFLGAIILARMAMKKFFIFSAVLLAAAMAVLAFAHAQWIIYVCIAALGFANSNIFSMIFSRALLHKPEKKNEVSGLMIMGVFGGTGFPLLMGFASDAVKAQSGAVLVMLVGAAYLIFLAAGKEKKASKA